MGLLNTAEAAADAGGKPNPADGETAAGAETIPEPVRQGILQYRSGTPLYGIIFEAPAGAEKDLNARLSHMSAFFGIVVPLLPRRSLLLFPKSMDGELVAHRLSRSLKTAPPVVFEAETPGQAVERLLNFL